MASLDELREELSQRKNTVKEINDRNAGESFSDEDKAAWNKENERIKEVEGVVKELEARERVVASLTEETAQESGADFSIPTSRAKGRDIYDLSTVRTAFGDPSVARKDLHDRAKESLERVHFPDERISDEEGRGAVTSLLEKDDQNGTIATHLLRTGSQEYATAWSKAVARGVEELNGPEQRALSTGGTAGGYALPYFLDPTVIPTSNLSVNPYRAVARVEQITTNIWHGVSSSGVSAQFASEAAEASDNSPQLAQPTITPNRAQVFIPFSFEVGEDWSGLQAEMARLIADSKDDLEAARFTTGTAASSVDGIQTGGTAVVLTAGTAAFVVGDVYAVENALGPRFRPRASFVGNRATYNKIRQFDTAGGASLFVTNLQLGLPNEVATPGALGGTRLLGYPTYECSSYSSTPTTSGQLTLTLGDWNYYVIVDRIGMSVDLIPHLFGSNQRPTGQKGLYARWRVGAGVIHINAFKTLKVL